MTCGNYCSRKDYADLTAPDLQTRGAAAEKFAKVVLAHELDLTAYNYTRESRGRGIDIAMRNPSQKLVVVEVKSSITDKPFSQLLKPAYNIPHRGGVQRQGSVGWLEGVRENALGEGKPADRIVRECLEEPERVPVIGVHIDPVHKMAHIFVRSDENAFEWKEIMDPIPLHLYVR